MRAAKKENLFEAIRAGDIYFDALFAVLYDGFAEIEREKIIASDETTEIIIYKNDGAGDKLNFFVLTDDKCGSICISVYIKTEEIFNFFYAYLQDYLLQYENLTDCTITVTDYYNNYVNERIINHSRLNIQFTSSNIYVPFCCFHPVKTSIENKTSYIRLMNVDDEVIAGSFGDDPDDYLENIFSYSVREPVYERCGVFSLFAKNSPDAEDYIFAAYLSFYGIEKYLDVSYVYVAEKWRRHGFAGTLMSAFLDYCIENKYIPYYSNADGEESKLLAEKYGFEPLGKRIEYQYIFKLTGD